MEVAAFYGVCVVWLSAAVLCCVRGRWLFLILGFFTFGLFWLVGAAAGTSGRRLVGGALIVLGLAVLVGAFGARPAPVLGIDGTTLQRSVGGRLAQGHEGGCTSLPGREWRCYQYDASGSVWLAFPVRVNGRGCWRSTDPTRRSPDVEGENRGCIHLGDYL